MIGQLLAGHYQVIEKLGAGGFGQTYIAEDIHRPGNPRCVVKHLKPASTDPQVLEIARKLFNKEAETLEKLGVHPQIPRLLAYFEEEEQFFLVQELIPGHPLSTELPPGKILPPEQVITLLQEVLDILKFVHGQMVIHRDIKPDNLIRDNTNNKLVLIDFGAIKQVRNQPLTQEGLISATVAVGTPGYMPTEQARGTPRPNSDIYALGMVGIQALTGVMPYQLAEDNDTGEILWQHLVTGSPELVAILERMTRYHFRDRYNNVNQVREALSQLGNISMPASVKPTQLATALGQQTVQEITLEWLEAGEIRRQVVKQGQASKNPGTVRLGRDQSRCDVVFSDPSVSGLQGEIFFHPQQGSFSLRALRETNPVQVDGQSFATGEMPLHQGSQIQLGQTQIRVVSITSTASQGSSPPPQSIEPNQFNNYTPVPPTVPAPETGIANPTTKQTVAVSPAGNYSSSTQTPTSSPPAKSRVPLLVGALATASMLGIAGGFGMIQLLGNQNPNPGIDPPPTSTPNPPQAKACLAQIVNGNIRKEPADFFENVITTFAQKSLPVTGKQTQGGWIEVEVNKDTSGWAHRSVIRNEGEIDSCLQEKGQKIEFIADIPRPPAKGEKFLQQARELAAEGEWQGAINLAEKVPADSELFNEAQDLVEKWQGNLPTEPVNPIKPTEPPDPVEPPPGEALNQILPEYVANALDVSEVFAECPGKTELYLFGETKEYNFAVCGNNNKPRYYIGQDKDSQDKITVPWVGGFYNGAYLYEPPIYGQINPTDNQLQVYLKGDLIVKDGIIRLYEGGD